MTHSNVVKGLVRQNYGVNHLCPIKFLHIMNEKIGKNFITVSFFAWWKRHLRVYHLIAGLLWLDGSNTERSYNLYLYPSCHLLS